MQILITGFFHQECLDLAKFNLLCICGDVSIPVEYVQVGVYRCFIPPHVPTLVNLFISLDGHKPISQVLNFEYRSPVTSNSIVPSEENKWEEFRLQMRLANLLFSSSKSLNIVSSKVSPSALKEAKKFSQRTAHISNRWQYLIKSIEDNNPPLPLAKDHLFELILKNRLKDWLLEKVLESSKTKEYDVHGQGVVHLCAILGYAWAVHMISWSGLSLDFRDRRGWTALHWAAYHGRYALFLSLSVIIYITFLRHDYIISYNSVICMFVSNISSTSLLRFCITSMFERSNFISSPHSRKLELYLNNTYLGFTEFV